MIPTGYFAVEPWAVREPKLDRDLLGQTESIFALSNGHIGWRANLEEGEPHAILGAYLNAVYEEVPLPVAESAYGFPEAGQTMVNVADGKIIRLLVNDEPFDLRYGTLIEHERVLDLKAGVLHRTVVWESPAHRRVRIRSTRLVSLVHRALAAIRYEVEPVDGSLDVVVQSELVANEPVIAHIREDPRSAAAVENAFEGELVDTNDRGGLLIHSTRKSRLRVAAAMDHEVRGPHGLDTSSDGRTDLARFTIAGTVPRGRRLTLVKYVAYGWSSLRSVEALRDQVEGDLASAREQGWDGLVRAQRRFLAAFWSQSDVELNGDDEVQQAIRFAMFHVMQASVRAEQRAIPAKGLTGPGYSGHTFWDTETFVLPVLTYTWPTSVADALRWRHSILESARNRARELGLQGAAFPWRTIRGEEGSGYWPASVAAMHVNADIADAVMRYVSGTGDVAFERDYGAELLIETARLWASIGHFDRGGKFRIDGVTGPDEYSALMDNNLYTNLMAQQNLDGAANAVARHPDVAKRLKVSAREVKAWRRAAANVYIPYDPDLRIHKQASQFTDHEVWDFEHTKPEQYPLFLHFPYFDIYRKQVVKQADLVLAMAKRGDAFTAEEKARNFAYYEALTVRDSSLSSCIQAVMAAEVGHLQLAHDYLAEAALMDLRDLEHNLRDGVHMASLAGAWLAAVLGFGCMRHHGEQLGFSPRLPPAIKSLTFRVTFRERQIRVSFDHRRVTYTLDRGRPISVHHYDDTIRLARGKPVRRNLPRLPSLPEPTQPAGRAPSRRGAAATPPRLRGGGGAAAGGAAPPPRLRGGGGAAAGGAASPPRLRGGGGAAAGGATPPSYQTPPTSTPPSRRLPSAGRQPSRRRPSKRSPAPASARRRRGP